MTPAFGTPKKELARYTPLQSKFLDQVLDEFGLIVCGWSGEWDKALVSAITKCPTRRYTTFWMARGPLGNVAADLVRKRNAEIVPIQDADRGLSELTEKIEALKAMDRPHALSADVAVATVKRYLGETRFRIPLIDLFQDELARVEAAINSDTFGMYANKNDNETITQAFRQRMVTYEAITDNLLAMTITLAHYDTGNYRQLLTSAEERLSAVSMVSGLNVLLGLRRYPALLLMYGGGIAALATENYESLAALLLQPTLRGEETKRERVAEVLNVWYVFKSGAYKLVPRPNAQNEHTPANLYIRDLLAPHIQTIASGDRYAELFDRFEWILALACMDAQADNQRSWVPHGAATPGNFGLMSNWSGSAVKVYADGLVQQGPASPLVKAGFFHGSADRQKEIVDAVIKYFTDNRPHW